MNPWLVASPQAVQYMPSKRVAHRNARVVEILRPIAAHTDLLHYTLRLRIGDCGERNKLIQAKHFKGMPHYRETSFGRKALAPDIRRQPPADFDAGSECRLKLWNMDSNEANKSLLIFQLRCIQSESVINEVRFNVIRETIALIWREYAQHEFHDTRVGVEPRKRLAILCPPASQEQPLRFNDT
jgi:hypothetical protein